MEEQTLTQTPLDSLETKAEKGHPALTWLIRYGAYLLLVRISYVVLVPLFTAIVIRDSSKMQAVYAGFNALTTVGNIAIAAAIIVFVKDRMCRAVFILTILLNFYSLFTTLISARM